MVPTLVALNLAVFAWTVVQARSLLDNADAALFRAWALVPAAVADGEWWRLVTAGFLHIGPLHIAFNMFALWVLGRDLEIVLGRGRFLALYLVSLLGGSAAVVLFADPDQYVAGASGAVFGLMSGLLLVLVRLRRPYGQVVAIIVLNLVITQVVPGISMAGHVGGLVVGGLAAAALVFAPPRAASCRPPRWLCSPRCSSRRSPPTSRAWLSPRTALKKGRVGPVLIRAAWEDWWVQGRADPQREILDVESVAGHLLPAGGMFAFLAGHRRELFPEEMFADLFKPGGRPSVPAEVIASVIVLQTLNGLSDTEAVEALTFDLRWKAACGLAVTATGFHPTTLTVWRGRLRRSARPNRIFDAVRVVVGADRGADRARPAGRWIPRSSTMRSPPRTR